jgi:hypothetical protein
MSGYYKASYSRPQSSSIVIIKIRICSSDHYDYHVTSQLESEHLL